MRALKFLVSGSRHQSFLSSKTTLMFRNPQPVDYCGWMGLDELRLISVAMAASIC